MVASDVDTLTRWGDGGGQWRLVEIGPSRAVVELLTCHGEAVDRVESEDPTFVAFVCEHPRGGAFDDA